jgi:hypothetical protein
MKVPTRGRPSLDRLLAHLVGDAASHPLTDEVRGWLAGSRRFREFADAHRDKVRKKLRGAADDDALLDVRAELRVAHLLLADRRIELDYEGFGSTTGGPDFTVRLGSERPMNLEVTRLRRRPTEVSDGGPILAKLRQLPPGMPNVLVVRIDGAGAAEHDVERVIADLHRRADGHDEGLFTRRGLEGTRDFSARFRRLGGVVTWCENATAGGRTALWTNPSARIGLPDRTIRACVACLSRPRAST